MANVIKLGIAKSKAYKWGKNSKGACPNCSQSDITFDINTGARQVMPAFITITFGKLMETLIIQTNRSVPVCTVV